MTIGIKSFLTLAAAGCLILPGQAGAQLNTGGAAQVTGAQNLNATTQAADLNATSSQNVSAGVNAKVDDDKVRKAADKTRDKAEATANKVGDRVEKTGDRAEATAKRTADRVEKTAEKTADRAENTAEKAADRTKDAAKSARKTVKNAADGETSAGAKVKSDEDGTSVEADAERKSGNNED